MHQRPFHFAHTKSHSITFEHSELNNERCYWTHRFTVDPCIRQDEDRSFQNPLVDNVENQDGTVVNIERFHRLTGHGTESRHAQ